MKRTLRFALPLLLALASSHAHAGNDPAKLAQAKTYFKAGAAAYDSGNYGAAIQAFGQAYALTPHPQILFSMAQAERKAWYVDKRVDDLKHAIEHYHGYLDQVPTGGRRADAADALAELEPIAAKLSGGSATPTTEKPPEPKTRLMVTSPTPGAKASFDGGQPTGVPAIDDVKPGKHHVRVTAEGYFDEEVDAMAESGSLAAIDVPLKDKPALLLVQLDASAAIWIDGRPTATTPLNAPIELSAGTHFVTIAKNGDKPWTREVTLERGKQTSLPVSSDALESTAQRKAAWIVLATGGAAVVAGGVFTAIALHDQTKAQNVLDAQGRGNIPGSDIGNYESARDARDRWRTAAIVSFGTGVGLLLVSGGLFLFDKPSVELPPASKEGSPKPKEPPKNEPSMDVGLAPWALPGGAGASFFGTF